MAAVGALAALVLTAGCGGREANAPLPALGFNDDWHTYKPSRDPNRDPFKLAKAIGVKVARFPLGWPTVGVAGSRLTGSCRQRPGNWHLYDTVYHRLTGSRACTNEPPAPDAIAPLPIVVGAPPRYDRACGDAKTPIVTDGAAANRAWRGFVENVADRYPLLKGIEVWNEPNLATFWGECPLDPGRYARLLEFAHDGIEHSSHPGIPILFAGLSPIDDSTSANWLTYLRRVFAAPGLAAPVPSLFDVMALHPYRSEQDVAAGRDFATAAATDVDLARAFLVDHGAEGKPVWVTEVGVANGEPLTNPKHVATADEQAIALRDIYEALRDHYVPVVIIHRFIDSMDPKIEPPGYGVLTTGYQKKPSYYCLAAIRGFGGSCP